jgi:hypothetical protein
MGSGAKSYMRKDMRRSLVIYAFAPDPSEFPIYYEENFISFFISEVFV